MKKFTVRDLYKTNSINELHNPNENEFYAVIKFEHLVDMDSPAANLPNNLTKTQYNSLPAFKKACYEVCEETFPVLVDNTSVQSSIESANIKLTSPSGKQIWLYKKHLNFATKDQISVFWKCANDPMKAFVGHVQLTREEMSLALAMSKIPFFATHQNYTNPLAK